MSRSNPPQSPPNSASNRDQNHSQHQSLSSGPTQIPYGSNNKSQRSQPSLSSRPTPVPYSHNQSNPNQSNPNQSRQRRAPPPPSSAQSQSDLAPPNNHQSRPPPSRSSQYHQQPHDYPEYVQHELKKEEDEKAPPQRARTEAFDNYHYQQRQQAFNPNYRNNNNYNSRGRGGRGRGRGRYAQSEQQHYRGNNRQRSEIAADPYSLQRVSAKLPKRPSRPYQPNYNDHNEKLFPVKLKSNSTEIKFRCEELIKYDIEFVPAVAEDAKLIRRNAINQCHKQIYDIYGTHFDDNTRLYAERDVKESHEFYWDVDNGKKIILKYGQKLRIQSLDLQYKKQIQGIILQSLIRKAELRRFGRGHYDMSKQSRLPIRGGADKFPKNLSLIPGYRPSLEMTVNGTMIGIDTCHRLIEDRTVQELMDSYRAEVERAEYGQDRAYIDNRIQLYAKDELQQRHVQCFTNGKLFRIDDIDFELNINSFIPNQEPPISIKDHWKQQYDVELVNESNGIIVHYAKLKKNEQNNSIQFIPPEICCLTGFSANHRSQRSVTTAVSKATKIPAHHRMKSTNKLVAKMKHIAEADHEISPFVEIPEDQTKEINAQILACPEVILKKESRRCYHITGPEMLQYDWKECSFIEKGHKIADWAIVYNQCEGEQVEDFIQALKKYAMDGGFGRAINEQTVAHIVVPNDDRWTWQNCLNHEIDAINHHNKQNGGKLLEAIIAIIPHHPQKLCDRIYQQIKQVCSTERAILSQCILAKHTSKNHVINGVLRQLLVKLGSIPWKIKFNLPHKRLDIITKPTMVIGINVNHAQKSNISVVGIAASFDRDFVRYFSRVIHQKQGVECINSDDLIPIIEQCLDNFQKCNQCLPQQLIVYRDGISETQIEECVETELRAFKQVLTSPQYKDYGIKMEFLCIQKRVNARFLISTNLESAPPGTAINDVVVSNQFWDFYLVPSKPPPKCVAIPTRCIVIEDGLLLSDNRGEGEMDLMHLTNSLCTLYFNWPGPTRVPAPIKYAQKIAQQYCQTLPQKHPHHLLDCSYHFL